jgi:hypothetical protein
VTRRTWAEKLPAIMLMNACWGDCCKLSKVSEYSWRQVGRKQLSQQY